MTAPRAAHEPLEAPHDLLITAERIARSVRVGRHASARMGPAIEFDDRRDYQPGDPHSRIDWRLAARADRLSIRLSRDEAQLDVVLALDASASMSFASLRRGADRASGGGDEAGNTKWRCAQRLAASIAMIVARQGDRIGLALARDGAAATLIRPRAGFDAARAVIDALATTEPRGQADLVESLSLVRRLPAASLVVALGDALEDPAPLLRAFAGLRASRAPREAVLLQTLAPDELDLTRLRAARLRDPERHLARAASASDAPAYRHAIEDHLTRLSDGLAAIRVRAVLARTDAEPASVLRTAFSRRVGGPR